LLSRLSNAKPKIANYAFTTLVPNIGVCKMDSETTTFSDVPGLIEGASDGRGLGHEFLRHVSRARTLVHIIDGTSRDPVYDYRAIRVELELFGMGLSEKPELIAYNKVDVPDSGDYIDEVKELLQEVCHVPPESIVPISAVTGEGVVELVRATLESSNCSHLIWLSTLLLVNCWQAMCCVVRASGSVKDDTSHVGSLLCMLWIFRCLSFEGC
jgi:GTPase